jgi:hypothetical protein
MVKPMNNEKLKIDLIKTTGYSQCCGYMQYGHERYK